MTYNKYNFLFLVGLIFLLFSLGGCTAPIEPVDPNPPTSSDPNTDLNPPDPINNTQPTESEPDPNNPSDPTNPTTPNDSNPTTPDETTTETPTDEEIDLMAISTIPIITKVSASDFEVTSTMNNSPDKAFDNDYSENSRWSARGTQWLQFDFRKTTSVSKINIYFLSRNRTSYFELTYSQDGKKWETLGNFSSQSSADWFEPFTFEPKNMKYLRYTGYGNSVNDWNSLIEVNFVEIPQKPQDSTETTPNPTPTDPTPTDPTPTNPTPTDPTPTCTGDSTRSCNILNGQGTQSRTCSNGLWSTWSTCTVTSCNNGYELQNNQCVAKETSSSTLSSFCSTNTFVPSKNMALSLRTAADCSKIVYIDPTYSGTGDGSSPSSPLKSWNEVSALESNTAYLQKRGTKDTANKLFNMRRLDNVLIGSYGSGNKPTLTSTVDSSGDTALFDIRGSTRITVRDISLSSPKNPSAIRIGHHYSTRSKDIMIYNVSIDTTSYTGIRCFSTDNLKVLHSSIRNIPDDGIYCKDSTSVEFGYNTIQKVNTNWAGPSTPSDDASGDSIQLGNVTNWYIHNNLLDRSDSGNKFAFIANTYSHNGIFECNTVKGPMPTGGGSSIYIGSYHENLITRYNHIIGPTHSSIYCKSAISFYGNLLEGTGASKITCSTCEVRDNVVVA